MDIKRPLTEDEIKNILSFIQPLLGLPIEIAESVVERHIINYTKQLKSIQLYPCLIPKLKETLAYQFRKAQICSGKSIGALASSSIGEKNTQNSLSSFHQAGQLQVNLSTGIPRLEELLYVTKCIKTPSMEICLNLGEDKLKDLSIVKCISERVFEYKEMIDFIIDYDMQKERELTPDEEIWYDFHRTFYNNDFEEHKWSVRIFYDINAIYKYRKSLYSIAEIIEKHYADAFCVISPNNIGIIDIYLSTDELASVDTILSSIKAVRKRSKKKIENDNDDLDLLIDDDNKEYYFIRDLVIPSLLYIQVSGIEGIKKCYFQQDKNNNWTIVTKGSNLKAIINNPLININKTTSNHLWDIYEVLGIEATKIFLRLEFEKLSTVSSRHLDLLINSMTYSGKPLACTRYGISLKQVGSLAKISFEQPFEGIGHAAINSEKENTAGVSAAIILGKRPAIGSGMSTLVDQINGKIIKDEKLIYEFNKDLLLTLKDDQERIKKMKERKMISHNIQENQINLNQLSSQYQIKESNFKNNSFKGLSFKKSDNLWIDNPVKNVFNSEIVVETIFEDSY
jgi:hypothetical protein